MGLRPFNGLRGRERPRVTTEKTRWKESEQGKWSKHNCLQPQTENK